METNPNPPPHFQEKDRLISTYSNDQEIRGLVIEFINEMPKRIRTANEAFMRGDRLRLQLWAHQIKGGAGGYGFLEISNIAAELENTLSSNKSSEEVFLALLKVIDLCERASVD